MNAPTKIASSLHSAMAAAFGKIESATKAAAGQVGQQRYKYADIGAVIEAIKPALISENLFFTQHPEPSERGVCIETFLHHASGESISLGKLFVPANKQDAQGFGSALTYARRYALVTAFGVPTEDDDGNAASAPQPKQQEKQADKPKLDPSAKINEKARHALQDLIIKSGGDVSAFCRDGGIQSLADLTNARCAELAAPLKAKLAANPTPFGELENDQIPY